MEYLLWKLWFDVQATATLPPQLWQPSSGILMTNDITDTNPEEAVPCIALSKNDSYVMSASGGKVSLFNMMTFKVCFFGHLMFSEHDLIVPLLLFHLDSSMQVMTTFMPPPPAATFLAFHPQDNNIIAIGMEDSTIHIYNVRVDEVRDYDRDYVCCNCVVFICIADMALL